MLILPTYSLIMYSIEAILFHKKSGFSQRTHTAIIITCAPCRESQKAKVDCGERELSYVWHLYVSLTELVSPASYLSG